MFYIGADPEVFVGNTTGVKSIIGRIGGTKDNPRPMPIGEGFAVQEDNVALEYNIPASPTKELFVANIASAMDFLSHVMHDMHGLNLLKDSAISFPEEELLHPMALQFGCDPDYNAWTNRKNKKPSAKDKNLRSCGGHVHIGVLGTKYEMTDPRSIIRACDLYLGVPSVIMDTGDLRKQLYGKAGCFRQKRYGVEYRTLSNFWVFEKKYTEWVYENTERALDAAYNKMPLAVDGKLIREAINKNNRPLAHELVAKYSLQLV